jgi:hypothetical protein
MSVDALERRFDASFQNSTYQKKAKGDSCVSYFILNL